MERKKNLRSNNFTYIYTRTCKNGINHHFNTHIQACTNEDLGTVQTEPLGSKVLQGLY